MMETPLAATNGANGANGNGIAAADRGGGEHHAFGNGNGEVPLEYSPSPPPVAFKVLLLLLLLLLPRVHPSSFSVCLSVSVSPPYLIPT